MPFVWEDLLRFSPYLIPLYALGIHTVSLVTHKRADHTNKTYKMYTKHFKTFHIAGLVFAILLLGLSIYFARMPHENYSPNRNVMSVLTGMCIMCFVVSLSVAIFWMTIPKPKSVLNTLSSVSLLSVSILFLLLFLRAKYGQMKYIESITAESDDKDAVEQFLSQK